MGKKKNATKLHFILIGGKGVGKYSLREQYIKGWIAPREFDAPPGSSSQTIVLDKKTIQVTVSIIQDLKSGGDEIENCQGIAVLYNISDKNSLEYIRNEVIQILKDSSSSDAAESISRPVILVGNKADEAKLNRQVSEEDGKKLSDELECCGFFETSATCNENVKKAFETLVGKVLENHAAQNPDNEKRKKKTNCVIL